MIRASELTPANEDEAAAYFAKHPAPRESLTVDEMLEVMAHPNAAEKKRARMKLYMREYRKTHPRKKGQ